MLYAKVNKDGAIIDVATTQSDDYKVLVAPDDPIVAALLEEKFKSTETNTQELLSGSDNDMMRIIEDLIDLLSEKRIIQFTELPIAAQKKLLSRKWVRGVHSSGDESLIDEEFSSSDNDSLI
ncbi:hypothetical protein [Marinomonas pollencensis]|uniref:Tryptophan synthase subunit beta like protein n=1 Tax=Marinomonas pollencensis TaxID=491954 RepID=A0A3E0DMU1_9GAMM|nr:hypothetical protein [Marinomonas pollencensis]REG84174.1 hypothetical protein DFP81_10453 [Marinomonas pollencensis]